MPENRSPNTCTQHLDRFSIKFQYYDAINVKPQPNT
jgi:hypothetical protein